VRFFELDEPAEKPIVLRIADERVVEDVVMEIMFFDLLTKLRISRLTAARDSLDMASG
jgi:hypothetical protein